MDFRNIGLLLLISAVGLNNASEDRSLRTQQDLHFMHNAIQDNHSDMHNNFDQKLKMEIEAVLSEEFGYYDAQSPLVIKAVQRAFDLHKHTNSNWPEACTFAVQALHCARNVAQIDTFYYISCIAIILLQQSPAQAMKLVTMYAHNDMQDDEFDEKEYLEIQDIVMQKVHSSPEAEQCLIRAIKLIKAGLTLEQIDRFITLIASSNSTDIDCIDSYTLFLFCFAKLILG